MASECTLCKHRDECLALGSIIDCTVSYGVQHFERGYHCWCIKEDGYLNKQKISELISKIDKLPYGYSLGIPFLEKALKEHGDITIGELFDMRMEALERLMEEENGTDL